MRNNIFGEIFTKFQLPGADALNTVPVSVIVDKGAYDVFNLLLVNGINNLQLVDGDSVLKLAVQ